MANTGSQVIPISMQSTHKAQHALKLDEIQTHKNGMLGIDNRYYTLMNIYIYIQNASLSFNLIQNMLNSEAMIYPWITHAHGLSSTNLARILRQLKTLSLTFQGTDIRQKRVRNILRITLRRYISSIFRPHHMFSSMQQKLCPFFKVYQASKELICTSMNYIYELILVILMFLNICV